jgi:hypothetical protein
MMAGGVATLHGIFKLGSAGAAGAEALAGWLLFHTRIV